MKALIILVLVALLASCKKDNVSTAPATKEVFLRVEVVGEDGMSSYSPIIVTKIK